MVDLLTLLIIVVVICMAAYSSYTTKKYEKPKPSSVKMKNLFHETVGVQSENHEDRIGTHLIEHPKAEPGYIVLNGIKRKIEDCKDL